MSRKHLLLLLMSTLLILNGCANSVRMVRPTPPPTRPDATHPNPNPVNQPVDFEVAFDARAVRSTFKATVRPMSMTSFSPCTAPCIDITSEFAGGTTARWPTQFTLTPGDYILRIEADMSPSQAFDFIGGDDFFAVNAPPPTAPSAVNSISPGSGIIGTDVTIMGSGFAPSHAVTFGMSNLATTYVSGGEIHFSVPQMAAGTYPVSVAGVGSLTFNLNNGTLSASTSPLSLRPGNNMNVTITLPAAAPPGGVRLASSAVPSNLVQMPPSLSFGSSVASRPLDVESQRLGSGTIQISGTGYNALSLAFTSAFGPAQCRARASASPGGVDLFDLATGRLSTNIASTNTPQRVVTSPDGRRAVAQYLTGITFIDLVNCRQLGSFQQTSTPFNLWIFSDDSQYVASDWINAAVGSGINGFELIAGRQVFSDTASGASQNVVVASDASAGTFAFWVTSGPAGIFLSSYRFTSSPHACNWGNVPSNNISVSFPGGVATINFMGIPTPQTWRVDPNTCTRLP